MKAAVLIPVTIMVNLTPGDIHFLKRFPRTSIGANTFLIRKNKFESMKKGDTEFIKIIEEKLKVVKVLIIGNDPDIDIK
jgi:hypothetical protein